MNLGQLEPTSFRFESNRDGNAAQEKQSRGAHRQKCHMTFICSVRALDTTTQHPQRGYLDA